MVILLSASNNLSQEEQILTLRYNQENSTVSCPNCQSDVLYYDDYCYNCGCELKNIQKKKIEKVTNINKALLLKYASVCLVNELISNPFLFQEITGDTMEYKPLMIDELLIHFKPITVYEVLDYILEEGYIVMLEDDDKYKSFFSHCNEEYISHLIEHFNLKPATSNEGNIIFLINQLPRDTLENITSNGIMENRGSNFFELTDKGNKLVEDNVKCLFFDEIFYDFNIEYYDNHVNNVVNKNDLMELLDESVNDSIDTLKWQAYSDLLYKVAEVYDYFDDTDNMLNYLLQHVICEFNPYADNTIKVRIGINEQLKDKVIYALSKSNRDYEEISPIIQKAYDSLRLPKNFITEEDVELLVEELFFVPEIRDVNKHLIKIYGFERIEEELIFNNQGELEKIIDKIESSYIK